MIKLTVLYPNTPDLKFDKEYYVNKHGQLLTDLLGDAIISSDVNMGIAGAPDTPAPYVVIANMVLNLWSRLNILFGANAEKIMADLPNFTNVQPQVQISELL
jgi:uncharacterized protein (TIGR02118 family)